MTADAVDADTGPRVRGRLRGAILKRAADLASLDGLDQVTIGRLASAMGMSKSGLYAYFTSKENLQLATIDCAWRIFEDHVLAPGDDPLEALLERWISYYEQEIFAGGCPFVTAGAEFANRDGPVREALAAAIERQLTALEQGVARAHASRLLTDTDARQAAFELHAIITAGNQRFRISRDPAAFAQTRTALTRLLAADPPMSHDGRRTPRGAGALAARGAGSTVRAPKRDQPPPSRTSGSVGGHHMADIDPAGLHPEAHTAVDLLAVDHVALAVADAGAMASFLCGYVGMQELDRSADRIVVGADSQATRLFLIAAEGPREPAALGRLVLRVADLDRAAARLPADAEVQDEGPDLITFDGPEGLGLGFTLVAGGGIDYDLDHVVLRVAEPEETRIAMAEVGCVPRGDTLHVADKQIRLEELPAWSERPLLDHIAILVEAIDAITAQARERKLEVDERRADGTLTIVLPGPERIRLDFVAETDRE